MTETKYEKSLRHAREHVHVVAARRGWDTSSLVAVFDEGRVPGIYSEHTLTISVRDTYLSAAASGIPHEWIEIGTGFIDLRFSQRIAMLFTELETKAAAV